jgi:hypothetical protein
MKRISEAMASAQDPLELLTLAKPKCSAFLEYLYSNSPDGDHVWVPLPTQPLLFSLEWFKLKF